MDILIVAHNKDFNKLKFVISSIRQYISEAEDIHLIVNIINKEIEDLTDVIIHHEDDVLKIDKEKIKFRSMWIYQQLLKLFQDVTKTEYLVIDADAIINKPLQIKTINKHNIFIGNNKHHDPYFNFNQQILGIKKYYNKSFICEIMLFNKEIIKKMLGNYTINSFIEKCYNIINKKCYMSEYELYGNYLYKNYFPTISIKPLNIKMHAKRERLEGTWKEGDIKKLINKYKNKNIDIFTIHSYMVGH